MSKDGSSYWQVGADPETHTTFARLMLTKKDRERMHRDRLALIDQADVLMKRAFADPEKPLPKT